MGRICVAFIGCRVEGNAACSVVAAAAAAAGGVPSGVGGGKPVPPIDEALRQKWPRRLVIQLPRQRRPPHRRRSGPRAPVHAEERRPGEILEEGQQSGREISQPFWV